MRRYELEKHTLLPLHKSNFSSSINLSSSSGDDNENSDHDNDIQFQNRKKRFRTKLIDAIRSTSSAMTVNNRRKLHLNRGIGKRVTRFLLCAFMVPVMLILTLYSSIFSGTSSRHYPLPDWDFSVSLNISDYVIPMNDTTILEPRNKCNGTFFIIIVVCSGLNNFVARYDIVDKVSEKHGAILRNLITACLRTCIHI